MVTDEQLVGLMAKGDQAAFEAFVHRYHAPLLGYLERMLRHGPKAEDLVQETFLRLIRQLRQGEVPQRIRPWLYKVAANLCRDYWRSAGFRMNREMTGDIPEQPEDKPSVVEIFERQETRRELLQVLELLPDIQREIIILRFFQDLKLQDIADILEVPLGTVKANLYQSLKKLKRYYERSGNQAQEREGKAHAIASRH